MSAETPNPQPGDRVKVSYVTEYADDGSILPMGRLVEDVTVEVLERADDPTIGEIRAVAPSADGTPKTAVKVGSRLSTNPGERCMWVIVETGEMLADGNVSGLGEVIGAVPDSPAAKVQSPARRSVRVPNEPHGLPLPLREEVADQVLHGQIDAAVDMLVQRTHLNAGGARTYIEDMPEYQTYLAAHGEKRAARVFRSDGPEPPAGVDRLEASHDIQGWTHVERDGEWWRWTSQNGRALGAQAWRNLASHIEFREVA